jgi:hypothetical protein
MVHRDVSDQPNPDGALSERLLPGEGGDAGTLTAREAASFLQISAATLQSWEQEFGFPASMRSAHHDLNYLMTELLALQDALADALSITSAVHTARQSVDRSAEPQSEVSVAAISPTEGRGRQ